MIFKDPDFWTFWTHIYEEIEISLLCFMHFDWLTGKGVNTHDVIPMIKGANNNKVVPILFSEYEIVCLFWNELIG